MEDLCQCNVRGPQWELTYFSYRPLNNNLLTCSLSVSLKLYILLMWVNRYWSPTSLRVHALGSLRRRARRNGCLRRLCIRLEIQNSNCDKKSSCKGKLSRHFTEEWSTCSPPNFQYLLVLLSGAPNDNFRKNICSEDDLKSRIFETFVVKFLPCLSLLGFSNI